MVARRQPCHHTNTFWLVFYTSTLTNYGTKRSIKQGRIHLPGVSGGKEIISEQDDVYIHTIQHGYQPQSHKI